MIDLNKAGAWDAKEQLEIAELLRVIRMQFSDIRAYTKDGELAKICASHEAMIDAATGGEG